MYFKEMHLLVKSRMQLRFLQLGSQVANLSQGGQSLRYFNMLTVCYLHAQCCHLFGLKGHYQKHCT